MTRRTLAGEARFEGLGLHSGVPVHVCVHPAEDGIHFRLGASRWKATPSNVSDTTRCTRLGEISTIEHMMSALAGLEITDAEVELDAGELPAAGGSALGYVEELQRVGLADLGEVEVSLPFKRVFHHEGSVKIAIGKGSGHWGYTYDLGERWPGVQPFESTDVVSDYGAEIAPARTFALLEEVPHVRAAGLAKGLDETSALILGPSGYENRALFVDEPARHKLLDFIGDLYLAGIPIRLLNATAEGSGHRTNVAAAQLLLDHIGAQKV
jgi:UDP-3-O-[3-hydroxymyristoyl] N-acetylglucosamine deacetylase